MKWTLAIHQRAKVCYRHPSLHYFLQDRVVHSAKRRLTLAMSSRSPNIVQFLSVQFPSVGTLASSEEDMTRLSHAIYPQITYTDTEKVEMSQWATTASRLTGPNEDKAKYHERLAVLNSHLSTRTTLLGSKPSAADLAVYHRLAPTVKAWSAEERTGKEGYPHIVRYMDFVQNAPVLGLSMMENEKIRIDLDDVRFVPKPLDPKVEKERLKKEKAASVAALEGEKPLVVGKGKNEASQDLSIDASAASTKREKKEKTPKQAKQPAAKAEATPLSPHLIDLRVGHILRAIPHPNADSLYVSTVACGDIEGTDNTSRDDATGKIVRTVCSGLNGLIPLEEMQNRKIAAVCNLKPVTMRGVKSAAMVLAASPRLAEGQVDDHKGPVELVEIPEGAEAGARICFVGWEGEPEGILNPKKKTWETLQPGFTTDTEGRVRFDVGAVESLKESEKGRDGDGSCLLTVKGGGGVCKVRSLTNAVVR